MVKRIVLFVLVLTLSVSLCGCGEKRVVAGEDYILSARKAYTALDSARVDVINDETGVSEQIFIFKYDEKDIMTYSYMGRSETERIAQYNNGYEQFTEENGVVTVLTSSDLGFSAYSRDIPYPYAGEGLIVFHKNAVIDEQSYIAQNDMATEVCHVYDIAKLGNSALDQSITAFSVKYFFDGDGNLLYLKEISDMTLEDGSKKTYSYSIYITQRNEVETVPNVVKVPGDMPDGGDDKPFELPGIFDDDSGMTV